MKRLLGLDEFAEEQLAFYSTIAMRMAVLTVVGLLPFSIYHILYGFMVVGIATAVVILLKTGVMLYLRSGGSGVVGVHVVALTYTATVALAVHVMGSTAYFWLFVAVVGSFYSLPSRSALIVNGLLCLLVLPVPFSDPELGVRLIVTLALVFFFGQILAKQVRDQSMDLHRLARIDPLTGAGNRRFMDEELERAAAEHERGRQPVSLLVVDLDHFKQVNDRFGHKRGDQVLIAVAEVLRERMRRSDRLFRFGGEEFVLVAPVTGRQGALRLAEGLRSAVAELDLGDVSGLTASIGVAERRMGESVSGWLMRADAALYAAKGAGRNQVKEAESSPPLNRQPQPLSSPG
jgi:diguanylate cyclase (GGDEF)-like protein